MAEEAYRRERIVWVPDDVVREPKKASQGHRQRPLVGELAVRVEDAATFETKVQHVARVLRRYRAETQGDYTQFKTALAPEFEQLRQEIRSQHQQTRAEVQATRADVLAAVKASPAQYVKLACEFGVLFLLFSLAVRFILRIELVNTAFALFMLFCLTTYWVMAHLKQRSENYKDGRASA